MASRGRGASHSRKLAKGRKRRVKEASIEGVIADHLVWVEQGGARQWEKDFTAAPIARRYGMPYRAPLSPQDVARGFGSRGNSDGDGCQGPQDESISRYGGFARPTTDTAREV